MYLPIPPYPDGRKEPISGDALYCFGLAIVLTIIILFISIPYFAKKDEIKQINYYKSVRAVIAIEHRRDIFPYIYVPNDDTMLMAIMENNLMDTWLYKSIKREDNE